MKRLNKILLWIWQIIQNIIGVIILLIVRNKSKKKKEEYLLDSGKIYTVVYYDVEYFFHSGVCLGEYIFLETRYLEEYQIRDEVAHEAGHQALQSRIFGPLYIVIFGIPSLFVNIWDRLFHKGWSNQARMEWYYSTPVEKNADSFLKVNRF